MHTRNSDHAKKEKIQPRDRSQESRYRMCIRVREPGHTTHLWKRATRLRKDRGSPRFSTSGWEGGKEDKLRAEKWIRSSPILGHTRERGKGDGQKRPDKFNGPAGATLTRSPHSSPAPYVLSSHSQAQNQSHFHAPQLCLVPQTHHPLL